MPAEFPETTLIHSGFGKTTPAELARAGTSLFGLLSPIDPQRSPFDLSKVKWGEVISAVAAAVALVFVALFAMSVIGA